MTRVPYSICKNLTFPEKVTSINIDKIQDAYVNNGPDIWPGAASINKKSTNEFITIMSSIII